MNEVEQWVAVAGFDQIKSRSVREVLTLVCPELALLVVVLFWASTFIVVKLAHDRSPSRRGMSTNCADYRGVAQSVTTTHWLNEECKWNG
jgi:hypothetical protein